MPFGLRVKIITLGTPAKANVPASWPAYDGRSIEETPSPFAAACRSAIKAGSKIAASSVDLCSIVMSGNSSTKAWTTASRVALLSARTSSVPEQRPGMTLVPPGHGVMRPTVATEPSCATAVC